MSSDRCRSTSSRSHPTALCSQRSRPQGHRGVPPHPALARGERNASRADHNAGQKGCPLHHANTVPKTARAASTWHPAAADALRTRCIPRHASWRKDAFRDAFACTERDCMTSTTTPLRPSHSHSLFLPFARLANEQPTPRISSPWINTLNSQCNWRAAAAAAFAVCASPQHQEKDVQCPSIQTRQNMT